jgi:uncharacterized protein (DUF2236 family)
MAPRTFGADSLLWDLVGQRLFGAASANAFILQAMHPAIGTVVDQRSSFRVDPWGRAYRSFASVQMWVYGGEQSLVESRRLREMHKTLEATAEDGTRYHALSAEPWAWVPLTSYHALVAATDLLLPKPLSAAQKQQAFDEVLDLCRLLQVPERLLPPTIEAYWAYFDDMVKTTLENTVAARDAVRTFSISPPPPELPRPMHPLWPALRRGAAPVERLFTVGLMPAAARDKLGLSWTETDQRRLEALGRAFAYANVAVPEPLKYMPIAYRARVAARAQQRLSREIERRPV